MVSSCNPLSSVLVVEDVVCTVEPLLGTAVTVYAVTGAPLAGTTGGVHVTVMDEPEVAVAVTLTGEDGTALVQREKKVKVREPFARYWFYMETYLKTQLCSRQHLSSQHC